MVEAPGIEPSGREPQHDATSPTETKPGAAGLNDQIRPVRSPCIILLKIASSAERAGALWGDCGVTAGATGALGRWSSPGAAQNLPPDPLESGGGSPREFSSRTSRHEAVTLRARDRDMVHHQKETMHEDPVQTPTVPRRRRPALDARRPRARGRSPTS